MSKENKILSIVSSTGLEQTTQVQIVSAFQQFSEQVEEWREKAESLVVTDVTQVKEMKDAKEARLALKKLRTTADAKRKELKEDSIKYGKAVQDAFNYIESQIKPLEEHLEKQEKFKELYDAKVKAELSSARIKEIYELGLEEHMVQNIDFGSLTEDDYSKLKNNALASKEIEIRRQQEVIEAEQKEKERQYLHATRKDIVFEQYWSYVEDKQMFYGDMDDASFKAICEALEKVKTADLLEKDRLRKEKEEADKLAAEQRRQAEEAQAKIKALEEEKIREQKKREAEAREAERKRLEAEAQAEAERKRIEQERIEEEKKKQNAPDKEKIVEYVSRLKLIQLETLSLSSEQGKKLESNIKGLIEKIINYSATELDKM